MSGGRDGEVVFLVDCLDGSFETAEERLGACEDGD